MRGSPHRDARGTGFASPSYGRESIRLARGNLGAIRPRNPNKDIVRLTRSIKNAVERFETQISKRLLIDLLFPDYFSPLSDALPAQGGAFIIVKISGLR